MNSPSVIALALAGALAAPTVLAQTCKSSIHPSAPDSRYDVNLIQGTVLDKQTGLIWKRCVEGRTGRNCDSGSPVYLSWGEALRLAAASTFAGHKDWRLPNGKELEGLVEVACYAPAINAAIFPSNPVNYVWSSTKSGHGPWYVHFELGGSSDYPRGNVLGAVRLVRGGQ